ncbi:MAG: hypothetical protein H7X95_01550, partial [Deltaproteobacteria bacterium]|nr:hypothetical protein [Deltaproteobacteria bacterium]
MYPPCISRLTFRTRLFLGVFLLFVGLVAGRVHGSSIAYAAINWAPREAMTHFLASPLLARMTPTQAAAWAPRLLATPRWIRADEWAHETPWALMQFNHHPRFPVVNTHIGEGQNMLVVPWVPVKHLSAVARPLTWGYMLFGPQSGLAWSWWVELFSGFLALYLVFELLIPHRPWLAVLGAGWFCASAYVACWSVWPAHVTAFGACAVVCAYHMVHSHRRRIILASGAALGVALAGFLMQLYPPWQVPLGYVFLLVFVGLVVRDRQDIKVRNEGRARLLSAGLMVTVFAVVFGSFFVDTREALSAFVNSDYPGKRRLLGGDCPTWRLFAGFYNYLTIDQPPVNSNSSESAGFFLLCPAAFAALATAGQLRRRFGATGWLLSGLMVFFLCFAEFGFPEWLANLTLMSRAQGFRAQIAIGLASIIISVQMLAVARHQSLRARSTLFTAAVVFVLCAGLFVALGMQFQNKTGYFAAADRLPSAVVMVSVAAAFMCTLVALGRGRLFGILMTLALLLTSGDFNPLSAGF